MATIGSGAPLLYVEGSATQTGGSGNKRTIKITAKFKVNGSSNWYYGYSCNWRARVDGTYGGWTAIKGTESWNGGQALRTFEQTLTVDVGTTSSKSITVGIYTDSQGDNGWDGSYTWSFTVGATNVAPTLSGTITADGTTSNKTIPENQTTIALSSPTASDSNLSGYRFAVSVNGGGYTEVYKGSSRTYTHSATGGEGTTYKYSCYAYDSAGLNSSTIYSPTISKNKLTADTLASTSSVGYSSSSIAFTYSGASNTNGNSTFTRTLSCDGITVYNPNLGASPATITIYKSGTVPTGCYVKFDDIKAKFASSNYKGDLIFSLTTTNAYGTKKSTSKTIPVNLQTAPNASGAPTMATDGNSTTYITSVGSTKYYIPANGRKTRINWTAGSGKLGEAVSYEVYVSYDGGSWQSIGTTTNNYFDHTFSQTVSAKQSVKYLVRTKVSYGLYADATQATAVDYHYWNPPSIVVSTPVRAATTATTTIALKLNTSIPSGVSPSGTWQSFVSGSATVHQSGTLTSSTANQNISMSGLAENSGYTLKITYKDNTAFSANIIQEVSIPANQPVFFVNKYGAGVGGAKASAGIALDVKGRIKATALDIPVIDNRSANPTPNDLPVRSISTFFNPNYGHTWTSGIYVKGWDNGYQSWQLAAPNSNTTDSKLKFRTGINTSWNDWETVYTTGNKPTPNEINAAENNRYKSKGSVASNAATQHVLLFSLNSTAENPAKGVYGVSFDLGISSVWNNTTNSSYSFKINGNAARWTINPLGQNFGERMLKNVEIYYSGSGSSWTTYITARITPLTTNEWNAVIAMENDLIPWTQTSVVAGNFATFSETGKIKIGSAETFNNSAATGLALVANLGAASGQNNIDNINQPGLFAMAQDSGASAGSGFPVPLAGGLLNIPSAYNTNQIYSSWNNGTGNGNRWFARTSQTSGRGGWKEFHFHNTQLNLGSSDLVMDASDPGDLVWKRSGTESARIWNQANGTLYFRGNGSAGFIMDMNGTSAWNGQLLPIRGANTGEIGGSSQYFYAGNFYTIRRNTEAGISTANMKENIRSIPDEVVNDLFNNVQIKEYYYKDSDQNYSREGIKVNMIIEDVKPEAHSEYLLMENGSYIKSDNLAPLAWRKIQLLQKDLEDSYELDALQEEEIQDLKDEVSLLKRELDEIKSMLTTPLPVL